jgi:hypothetical protein
VIAFDVYGIPGDGRFQPKHGGYGTPEYAAWIAMRKRCMNPKNASYQSYGGRGIAVCERWDDFSAFREDMGGRPSSIHSLGRIDNSRGYEPTNCRWETPTQQQSNRRSVRLLTHLGITLPLAHWAKRAGIPRATLAQRLHSGWSESRALMTPPDRRRASK